MSRIGIVAAVMLGIWMSSTVLADPDENEREGGILGTGIVGTITALGSIYVNGQHILFDPDTPVSDGVSVSEAIELAPGHTVAVLAKRDGDHWRASYIRQIVPLVGPLQKATDGRLAVMGTEILANDTNFGDISDGEWVAISGLWQSGRVVPTRVDPVSAAAGAQIEGTVFDFQVGQPLRLGGTDLAGLFPSHIQDGDVIRAKGIAGGASLQVSQLETGVFVRTPEIVFSEGYFSTPRSSGLYTVLGSNVVSYTDNPDMIDPTARQLVCSNMGRMFALSAEQAEVKTIASILNECLSGNAE